MTLTDRGFAELTDKQRDCLRLASQHMSSKEIARVLGISASAVEQRLKYAVRAVGARDRREAARLFSQWEQSCGEITYGPAVVEDAPPPLHPAVTGAQPSDAWERPQLADSVGYFDPKWDQPVGRAMFLPIPGQGRSPAFLGKGQRALWIAGITLCILLVFGVFVAGLEALSRLHG